MYSLNGNERESNASATKPRVQYLQIISFVLVVLILLVMGMGIAEVVRGLENDLAWQITAAGLVTGWVMVRFAKRGWTALLFSLTSGALFNSMMVGRLWDDWQRFFEEFIFWFLTVIQAAWRTLNGQTALPSIEQLFLITFDFTDSVFNILQRYVLWVVRFPRMNSDLFASLLIWGLVIWLTTIWAAWFLWRRGRPLEAVVPAFLLVAIARTYADASSNVVLVMLGGTIALMVLSAQAERESDWSTRGVGYSELIRKNSTQAAVMLSAVLVFAAGGITSIDIEELKERWEEFTTRQEESTVTTGQIRSSLGIEQDQERTTLAESFSKLSRGGLPTNHLVGSGPELAEEVVMVIRVEETDPLTGEPLEVDYPNQTYYFRSLTYDRYTSQGWFSDGGKIYVYQGGQEAIGTYTNRQRLLIQQVRYEGELTGLRKVHVVGDLAVVDRQYNVSWREGRGLSAFTDMFGATIDTRSYEAYSVVPAFSEDDLRDVVGSYPDWMETRYLELPPTVPDRVVDLAFEITQDALTNYDKAVAIEQYLRTFPYSLELPLRPANNDIADYFLFELKEGYCDYYASSMVVLARSVGIPARLAIGYIGGTYDPENNYYVVTADQAHSWAEIYFPEYGWVVFEPTAGRPAIARVNESFDLPEFEREISFLEETSQLSGLQVTLRVFFGVILFVLIVAIIWLQVDVFLLRRIAIDKAFAKLYRRVLWISKLLGIERGNAQTPLEFTKELQVQLEKLRKKHRALGYLDKSARRVNELIVLTNKAAYSLEQPDIFERAQAVDIFVELRRQLGFAIFWDWLLGLIPKINKKEAMPA